MRDITSYSANQVVMRLGKRSIIWVHPDSIRRIAKTVRTRKVKKFAEPFDRMGWIGCKRRGWNKLFYRNQYLIEDADFPEGLDFEEFDTFRLIEDLTKCGDEYRNSILFKQLSASFDEQGYAHYKRFGFASRAEIESFFHDYLRGLARSLSENGVQLGRSPDMPKCYLARDGSLIKGENGRHRLALAKSLRLETFPLQVFGVHEDWYHDRLGARANFRQLGEEIRKVEAMHR